jgi:hypothetical protein
MDLLVCQKLEDLGSYRNQFGDMVFEEKWVILEDGDPVELIKKVVIPFQATPSN